MNTDIMQAGSHHVTQAVFAALQADARLADRFSLYAAARDLPVFSFDGMRSQWRDRALGLVAHRPIFSLWAEEAGLSETDALAVRLAEAVAQLVLPAPLHLVHARLLQVDSDRDRDTRLWQQRLTYEVLTCEVAA